MDFNSDDPLPAAPVADTGGIIEAVDGVPLSGGQGDVEHDLLRQGLDFDDIEAGHPRQEDAGTLRVVHQELEHGVVHGVCDFHSGAFSGSKNTSVFGTVGGNRRAGVGGRVPKNTLFENIKNR